MSAQELKKRMYHIQELCNDLLEDLVEHGAPDFDTIVSEVRDAESEWENNKFYEAVETLNNVKDKIDHELNAVGNLDSRDDIIEWINNMPTSSFMDFA